MISDYEQVHCEIQAGLQTGDSFSGRIKAKEKPKAFKTHTHARTYSQSGVGRRGVWADR